MDRPEDVEANPVDGHVFCALTNNKGRGTECREPAGPNIDGHVIELIEANDDHTGTRFQWSLFLLCGPADRGGDNNGFADASPLSCPDNLAFLPDGSLVIATDGQIKTVDANDGLYVVPTQGPQRGRCQLMVSGLPGGEICGPCITNGKTLFLAIQHPGSDGRRNTCVRHVSQTADWQPRPAVVALSALMAPNRRSDVLSPKM